MIHDKKLPIFHNAQVSILRYFIYRKQEKFIILPHDISKDALHLPKPSIYQNALKHDDNINLHNINNMSNNRSNNTMSNNTISLHNMSNNTNSISLHNMSNNTISLHNMSNMSSIINNSSHNLPLISPLNTDDNLNNLHNSLLDDIKTPLAKTSYQYIKSPSENNNFLLPSENNNTPCYSYTPSLCTPGSNFHIHTNNFNPDFNMKEIEKAVNLPFDIRYEDKKRNVKDDISHLENTPLWYELQREFEKERKYFSDIEGLRRRSIYYISILREN